MSQVTAVRPISRMLADGEALRPILEVAHELGLRICQKTSRRWTIQGRSGVRLPATLAGGRRLTTRTALLQWLDDVAAAEQRGGQS